MKRTAAALLLVFAMVLVARLAPQQQGLRDYYNTTFRDNEDGVFKPAPSVFLADVFVN